MWVWGASAKCKLRLGPYNILDTFSFGTLLAISEAITLKLGVILQMDVSWD